MPTNEIWKPVVGYSGYEVSNQGHVRSWWNGRWGKLTEPKKLNPTINRNGYAVVNLTKDGKIKQVYVHRLVLEAFVGPCPDEMEGLHGENGPSDNSLNNLSWGTKSQNMMDRVRDGTDNRGEKHPLHKVKDSDIENMISQLESGMTQKEVADTFGINQSHVSRIKSGKSRGHSSKTTTPALG